MAFSSLFGFITGIRMHFVFVLLTCFSVTSVAQNLTEFQNGEVADANAINENFNQIKSAIVSLQQGSNPSTPQVVGTLKYDNEVVDLFALEHSWSREPDGSGTLSSPDYVPFQMAYRNSQGNELFDLNRLVFTGAADLPLEVTLAGGDGLDLTLASWLIKDIRSEPGLDETSSLLLDAYNMTWGTLDATLTVDVPQGSSDTTCEMPSIYSTEFDQKSQGSELILGAKLGFGREFGLYTWGSAQPQTISNPSADPLILTHANLQRIPCYFDGLASQLPVMQVSIGTNTVLTLTNARLLGASVKVSSEGQHLLSRWGYTTITRTSGTDSFCYDILLNNECR
jgi:hypothetical protein